MSRAILKLLLICVVVSGSIAVAAPEEHTGFATPLFGRGRTSRAEIDYLLPFYYHRFLPAEGRDYTLYPPLLTWRFRGPVASGAEIDGVLPLSLALLGTVDSPDLHFSGLGSPLLAAGRVRLPADGGGAEAAGCCLLPNLPLLGDLLRFDLMTWARAGDERGDFTSRHLLCLPNLEVGLYARRAAGIESDLRYLPLLGLSLYRSTCDLERKGFDPELSQYDATTVLRRIHWWPPRRFATAPDSAALLESLRGALGETRSGRPVERIGIIDPLLTYSRTGESVSAFGLRPLFYYDVDDGLSLPWLLTTLSAEGIRIGKPALRHLCPLIWGDEEQRNWQILAGLGGYHEQRDSLAIDLALTFSYRRHARRGVAIGLLPFPFGHFPGRQIHDGARSIQLAHHALAFWDVDGRSGVDVLHPFVFSMERGPRQRRWNALLFFEGSTTLDSEGCAEQRRLRTPLFRCAASADNSFELGILPFDLLFSFERKGREMLRHNALWGLLYSFQKRRDVVPST